MGLITAHTWSQVDALQRKTQAYVDDAFPNYKQSDNFDRWWQLIALNILLLLDEN